MTNTSTAELANLLSAISDGKLAMEQVPVLKNENAELYNMVGQLEETKRSAEQRIADLERRLSETQATLSDREASLSAATFRAEEGDKKLAHFKSLISGALGTVTESVEHAVDIVTESSPVPGDGGVMEPSPFAETPDSSPTATSPGASTTADASNDPSPSITSDYFDTAPEVAQPNAGKGHCQKPFEMSWGDWGDSGGEVPYYITSAHEHA